MRTKKPLTFLCLVILFLGLPACHGIAEDLWNSVLEANVKTDGLLQGVHTHVVDYQGVAANPNTTAYLDALKSVQIGPNSLNKETFYALFINVYNAFAMNMIAKHPCNRDPFGSCDGPLTTIKNLGLLPFGKLAVWKTDAGDVGGKSFSLDEIETMLRSPSSAGYNFPEDPRLHAAIVCASISCPNLQKTAYEAGQLDAQLNYTWNNWLANTEKGMLVDTSTGKVTVSSIFNWFGGDFTNAVTRLQPEIKDPTPLDFIMIYLEETHVDYDWLKENVPSGKYTLEYFDYNWDVNAEPGKLVCDENRLCFPFWALLATAGGLFLVILIIIIAACCVRHKLKQRVRYYNKIGDADI